MLNFTPAQRQQTVIRSDAGFGGDRNINRALKAHWQVLAKGKGGRRPQAYARSIALQDWLPISGDRWVASAVNPVTYLRPTQHWVLHWHTPSGEQKYSTIVCSVMEWSVQEVIAHYDDRGQCETEIQADKGGLRLERRRKKRLAAQEALVLLIDLAHNLLAWTAQWMFPSTDPLAAFGTTRLIEDVFTLQGRLCFVQNRLVEVHLNRQHPYAENVAQGLQRLLAHFGWP